MIYKIKISNFGSIRDTVELDFRIRGTTPNLPNFCENPAIPGMRLPAVIAILGANGAGKTTVLSAINRTLGFILRSHEHAASAILHPFFSTQGLVRPTRIEVSFAAARFLDGDDERAALYRYELELARDPANPLATHVAYEALLDFPNGRRRRIFERKGNEPVHIVRKAGITGQDRAVQATRPEVSLIATLAASFVPMFVAIRNNLSRIYSPPESWRPNEEMTTNNYAGDAELVAAVSRQLQRIDLGIESMDVATFAGNKRELVFTHQGLAGPLVMLQESAGTRNFLSHFPFLNDALSAGQVFLLDALDTEFHADLAAEIIHWFQSRETNPRGAQLICTLHNLALLESLEKEEVVIVEKNHKGVTSAYGLWQVKGLRRSSNLYREYRSGDLGGLPVIG